MPTLDLLFHVQGSRLRTDHAYALFSALSNAVPWLHDRASVYALAPITGHYVGQGLLALDPVRSFLRIRVEHTNVPHVLPVAGKSVRVMGDRIQIGVPRLRALTPSPVLWSRSVTIKHAEDEESFSRAARKQLDDLGIGGELEVPRLTLGPRQGEPKRHVLRVKDVSVVCFPLVVRGLQPDESLRLQESGLGGRRRLGAGLFVAVEEGGDA
jgi:CRISPR-associated protein Cas6